MKGQAVRLTLAILNIVKMNPMRTLSSAHCRITGHVLIKRLQSSDRYPAVSAVIIETASHCWSSPTGQTGRTI
jgi:hypothetical protein